LAATLTEIPLIDWEGDVQAEEELILGQESRNVAYYSFVQTSCRHERSQSSVQFLLVLGVRKYLSSRLWSLLVIVALELRLVLVVV